MKIKSVVNDFRSTMLNCESEAIHIPGTIQQHGFLLAITEGDFKVAFCSENCVEFLNKTHIELLGQNFETIFSKADVENIEQQFKEFSDDLLRPFIINYNKKTFHVTAHKSDEVIVLEFELFAEAKIDFPDLLFQMKRFAYHTERADNLQNLCQDIADETRSITGYDRVMIYRFDKEYNGEVFAESKKEDLEPFLHLHYPHTDIPAQARELYLRNLIRMKVDVGYTPVPIYTIDGILKNNSNLDLSMAILRSVSSMHLEYLKNMEVGATFVISIIHNKKLWGLISCHHYSAKHIPYHIRLAAHLQAVFLSSQIDVRQVADEFELTKQTNKKLQDLSEQFAIKQPIISNEQTLQLLKNLINADGIAIIHNGKIHTAGTVPSKDAMQSIADWFFDNIKSENFSSSKFSTEYLPSQQINNNVAGICCQRLGLLPGHAIFWLRNELETTISWGGDPNKAILLNEEKNLLTPRKSFAAWSESVKNQSSEWLRPELNAAAAISLVIQRQLYLIDLMEEEVKYRSLNEKLQKANDELANMNWISTHDLKEPLRKIQVYASIILEKYSSDIPEVVTANILRMQASAAKMQKLIEALVSYASLMYENAKFESVDLNTIIKEVVADLQEEIVDKDVTIDISTLPTVNGINFQLQQLFVNIISNSIKFAKKDVPLLINISSAITTDSNPTIYEAQSKQWCKITVADNGIGFNDNFKNDIFKVFQRLNANQYAGSGIGLAICKKIVESHNGYITAIGEINKGAQFDIYLPV